MIKRALITAGVLGTIAIAAPASAVTVVATAGTAANFAQTFPGLATTTFNFNSGNTATELAKFTAAGFTVTNAGSVGVASAPTVAGQYQVPSPGDNSPFAVVQNNSSVAFRNATVGYNLISLYLGSVDTYNSIAILSTSGATLATYTGTQLLQFATPVGTANGQTSYRITFTRSAGDVAFGGLQVTSTTDNSAEFDNLVFAVPEPSTWALMLAGFGMVGMAMRSRRRRTNVVFG